MIDIAKINAKQCVAIADSTCNNALLSAQIALVSNCATGENYYAI